MPLQACLQATFQPCQRSGRCCSSGTHVPQDIEVFGGHASHTENSHMAWLLTPPLHQLDRLADSAGWVWPGFEALVHRVKVSSM